MTCDPSVHKAVIAPKKENQGINHARNAFSAVLALTFWNNAIVLMETDIQESEKKFFIDQMYSLYSSEVFLEPKPPGYADITGICSRLYFLRQNELKDEAVNEVCSLIERSIIYFEESSHKAIQQALGKCYVRS